MCTDGFHRNREIKPTTYSREGFERLELFFFLFGLIARFVYVSRPADCDVLDMGQARARNVSVPSGLTTIAQASFLQQLVGCLVGFPDPVYDLVRFGRILQLDADGAVNA